MLSTLLEMPFVLGLQVWFGALLLETAFWLRPFQPRRPRLSPWRPLQRSLRLGAVTAFFVGLLFAAVHQLAGAVPSSPESLLLIALAGAPMVAACHFLLLAGWLERRGARRAARRTCRLAAGWALGGLAILPVGTAVALAAQSTVLTDARWLGAGLAGTIASGVAVVLAGLSGKPRPSGWLAAAAYVAGLACTLQGTH